MFARLRHARVGEGVGIAHEFLVANWPAPAPSSLVMLPADIVSGARNEHIAMSGQLDGRPLLVSLLDFAGKPRGGVRPPILAILVAAPVAPPADAHGIAGAPFRTSSRSLEDMPAHRELVGEGFSVHVGPAGIAAVREGEQPPLDVDSLERLANTVGELCRACPPAGEVPVGPSGAPAFDETSSGAVVEAFLGALRDGDALGVLERAHPRLFLDWPMEPSAAALAATLDASARPRSWDRGVYVHASSGGTSTLDTLAVLDRSAANCANLAITLQLPRGAAPASVCLLRLDQRHWQVSGYAVGRKQILGIEFPPASGG
jgi:hypothetical protein